MQPEDAIPINFEGKFANKSVSSAFSREVYAASVSDTDYSLVKA